MNYTENPNVCTQEATGEDHNWTPFVEYCRVMGLLSSPMELLSYLLKLELERADTPQTSISYMNVDNVFWAARLGKADTSPTSLSIGSF